MISYSMQLENMNWSGENETVKKFRSNGTVFLIDKRSGSCPRRLSVSKRCRSLDPYISMDLERSL